MTTNIVPFNDSAGGWQQALYAFLATNERRTGSQCTIESYSHMLQHFFGSLDNTPNEVAAQDVSFYAHGVALSGRHPYSATFGSRLDPIAGREIHRLQAAVSCAPRVTLSLGSLRGLRRWVSEDTIRRSLAERWRTRLGVISARPGTMLHNDAVRDSVNAIVPVATRSRLENRWEGKRLGHEFRSRCHSARVI